MSDPTEFDSLFGDLVDQDRMDKWIEGKQAVFEDQMVKKVLTKFNLMAQLAALKQDMRDWTGGEKDHLSFAWFYERHPGFPIRLATHNHLHAHKLTVLDLFRRFTTTPIYKQFMEVVENVPEDAQANACGLVFPWYGYMPMIIHNSKFVPFTTSATRIVRDMGGKGKQKEFVYLEPFAIFLDAVSTVWTP